MFQISRRTDYAVRIMVELAQHATGERIATRVVANRTGVPKAFLHKIAADLVRAGLIHTVSGPAGGLVLSKEPRAINLQEVVEAIEGPIRINICLVHGESCPREPICPAFGVWSELQALIHGHLSGFTLKSLADRAQILQANRMRMARTNRADFDDTGRQSQ